MLLPMIETSKLIALQALLALLQPMRKLPTLKRLVQDQGNALTNLWEGDRRGPFFGQFQVPDDSSLKLYFSPLMVDVM